MDHTLKEWIELSEGRTLPEAALCEQAAETGMEKEDVRREMARRLQIMKDSVQTGLDPVLKSNTGLTGGQSSLLHRRAKEGHSYAGAMLGLAEAYALATAETNAAMGKIVAAPTAGSCGILPGCLLAAAEVRHLTDELLTDALFTAAAVGQAIAGQASISGAECGCQAECGTAAAMAAAALVTLEDGTAAQACDAAGFAIMNLLGLVCDPAGGLVEVPCVYRNVGSCGIAFTAADLALSGVPCPIAPDEIIQAMKEVGDALPASLRETGEGGCAACPSIRARLCKK